MVDHQIRVPHRPTLIALAIFFAACGGADDRAADVAEVSVGPVAATATASSEPKPDPTVAPAATATATEQPPPRETATVQAASSVPSQPLPGLPPGTAKPVSAAQKAQAELLFQEGREALNRGDIALACSKFDQSLQAEEAGGTLINFADCSEKLGNHLKACRAYRRAQRLFDAKGDTTRFELAKQRGDNLRCPP